MKGKSAVTELPVVHSSDELLGYLLNDAARLMRRDFDRRSAGLGLTQSQWRVISFLSRRPGAHQVTIAEWLEVQPITLARLIDRMVASGWIERRPDPHDRRAVRLFLTDKVAPVRERIRATGAATRAAAFAGLTDDELGALLTILTKVKGNLAATEPASERPAPSRKAAHG